MRGSRLARIAASAGNVYILGYTLLGRPPDMNCRSAIFTLVLVGLTSPGGILEAQSAVPDSVARRIDSVFTKFGPDSPGCALGLYRDGRIVYNRGYGSADLERKVPLSPASVLDIGSTSKQFTAMSILLLQQDGKLSLNDDIRTYVPELPDYGTRITIGDMLHHISGLRDYTTLLVLAGNPTENWTTDQDARSPGPAARAQLQAGQRVAVQQLGLLPAVGDREAGERAVDPALCPEPDLRAAGYDPHPHPRRSHDGGSQPGYRLHPERQRWTL